MPLPLPAPAPAAIPAAPPQLASIPPPAPVPAITADYRSMLSSWLESHKRYPEEARQRGEEGRAVLRFRIARSGQVLDYAVVSSTGYADLDASLQAMMRGAAMPPFPPSIICCPRSKFRSPSGSACSDRRAGSVVSREGEAGRARKKWQFRRLRRHNAAMADTGSRSYSFLRLIPLVLLGLAGMAFVLVRRGQPLHDIRRLGGPS